MQKIVCFVFVKYFITIVESREAVHADIVLRTFVKNRMSKIVIELINKIIIVVGL